MPDVLISDSRFSSFNVPGYDHNAVGERSTFEIDAIELIRIPAHVLDTIDRSWQVMKKLRRDTIAEDDYSILDFGWDDRVEGKRKSDNPYAVNNWKNYEWEKGWLMADNSPDLDK